MMLSVLFIPSNETVIDQFNVLDNWLQSGKREKSDTVDWIFLCELSQIDSLTPVRLKWPLGSCVRPRKVAFFALGCLQL